MTRIAKARIDANRPRRGVRVTTLLIGEGHLVACGQCDYAEVVQHAPKAAADYVAKLHRYQHRRQAASA